MLSFFGGALRPKFWEGFAKSRFGAGFLEVLEGLMGSPYNIVAIL